MQNKLYILGREQGIGILLMHAVVQLLFLEDEPCAVSYETRQGKYQDQSEMVTIARV